MTDPTRQRDQPALTTSSGLIWLIMGGLLALISLIVLVPLGSWVAGAIVVVLYLGMLVVRFAVAPGRLRLGLLAAGMLAIAAVALIAVLVDAGAAAGGAS